MRDAVAEVLLESMIYPKSKLKGNVRRFSSSRLPLALLLFVGLDFFRPQPMTPNYKQKDFVFNVRDGYTLGGGLLQFSFSFKRFDANVWEQGRNEQTPRFAALDTELAKEFQLTKKYAVRLSLRGFNLTDHFTADPSCGRFLSSYRRYFACGFDIGFDCRERVEVQ
jgi:hypothetical protein